MKNFSLILIFIFLMTGYLFTKSEQIKLAISKFDDSITLVTENDRSGKVITEVLEIKYSDINRFYVRKSGAIQNYLNSVVQVQLGLANRNLIKGKSESLKINYLTVGTISKYNDIYEIDARTVNIDNWRIVHSHGCSKYNISSAIAEITKEISKKFTHSYIELKEKEDSDRPIISVFKFKDDNRLANEIGYSGAFAEILNSELGKNNNIVTIERTFTKSLLNEKMLEMAGVIENDNSNYMFNMEGISYKLSGNVIVFDDFICLNYSLYDTKEKRLIFLGKKEIGSSRGLRPIAKEIVAVIEDVLNNKVGTLKLISQPEEARVFLDGMPVGLTPLIISLEKGMHEIMVKLDGYETYKSEIEIRPKEINVQMAKLMPLSLTLLEQAYKFEKKRKWEEAVDAYSLFIQKYNETSEADNALYRKGHVEMQNLQRYEDAFNTFQKLVNRYPDTMIRAEAYYGLARVSSLMGNKKKAREYLKYLLERYADTYAAQEAKRNRKKF